MPVEFDCRDCGDHVFAAGIETAPSPPRCALCEWIDGIGPPAAREELRRALYSPRELLHWETAAFLWLF